MLASLGEREAETSLCLSLASRPLDKTDELKGSRVEATAHERRDGGTRPWNRRDWDGWKMVQRRMKYSGRYRTSQEPFRDHSQQAFQRHSQAPLTFLEVMNTLDARPSFRIERMAGTLFRSFSWFSDSSLFDTPILFIICFLRMDRFNNNPVVRVSSAKMSDAPFRTESARFERSSTQPMGVLTR